MLRSAQHDSQDTTQVLSREVYLQTSGCCWVARNLFLAHYMICDTFPLSQIEMNLEVGQTLSWV